MRFNRAFVIRDEHMHRYGRIASVVFKLNVYKFGNNIQTRKKNLNLWRALATLILDGATAALTLVARAMVIVRLNGDAQLRFGRVSHF